MSRISDALVTRLFFRGLVFNQSWEDPEVDRLALRVRAGEDRLLSIASGGCNGLSLLCLRPRSLTLLDSNPAQTQLVQLKLAGIRTLDHDDFYRLFGEGSPAGAVRLYERAIRAVLPPASRAYWDSHSGMLRRGLATSGKLGTFLVWLRRYLEWRIGKVRLERFFASTTIEEQRARYREEIEPRLWTGLTMRVLGSRVALSLAGMHPGQRALVDSAQGIPRYIRDRVEYVLTTLPLRENYFAARAALGHYLDPRASPPYLHEENFGVLRELADAVTIVTASLDSYAASLPPGSIDGFNLMDVFDWMTPDARSATFRSVLDAASERGRLIYRSTVVDASIPAEFSDRVVEERALADELFAGDRSFTYASFHVYAMRPNEDRPAAVSDARQAKRD